MAKFTKQTQATNYIKSLLASRNMQIEPGVIVLGEAEECQVFEYHNRCLAVDTKSGLWVGQLGGDWRQIANSCTVSGALQAVEFLTQD